jgi:hypothetical protein
MDVFEWDEQISVLKQLLRRRIGGEYMFIRFQEKINDKYSKDILIILLLFYSLASLGSEKVFVFNKHKDQSSIDVGDDVKDEI